MKSASLQQQLTEVFCNWGGALLQSTIMHIQALVSADIFVLYSSSKLRLLLINLASLSDGSRSIPELNKAPISSSSLPLYGKP
jgi:hypothetical protein